MQLLIVFAVFAGAKATVGGITVGINLSGLEEGSKVPGKANFDFAVPTAAEWAYFAGKAMRLVRLPFKWELGKSGREQTVGYQSHTVGRSGTPHLRDVMKYGRELDRECLKLTPRQPPVRSLVEGRPH